jgi:hypothetical protein
MSSGPGPRPSNNPNYAYEPVETPLLRASPDFWSLNEVDRSNAFEARARAYGGSGYRHYPDRSSERER